MTSGRFGGGGGGEGGIRSKRPQVKTAPNWSKRPQLQLHIGQNGPQKRPQKIAPGTSSTCYLGDMLSEAGGCELSTTTRGRGYSSCVRSTMLHASET